jgi:hypothetical protein
VNEKNILQLFRDTGLGFKVFESQETAYQWLEGQEMVSLPCCYNGFAHHVNPETCEHHIASNDPECLKQKCERLEESNRHLKTGKGNVFNPMPGIKTTETRKPFNFKELSKETPLKLIKDGQGEKTGQLAIFIDFPGVSRGVKRGQK